MSSAQTTTKTEEPTTDLARLFEPVRIRGLTLRNRLVVSPIATSSAVEGRATDLHVHHTAQRRCDRARRRAARRQATANGGLRSDVRVGEVVRFVGSAAQPAGAGFIVAAEWDVTGTGAFVKHPVSSDTAEVTGETMHAYDQPGTYFAAFRVGTHRDGTAGRPPFARNNARVRVVVRP